MTSSNTLPAGVSKPDVVALGELSIAAGLAGTSVALCISEMAATVDCELWKYFIRLAGAGNVVHVRTQADIRRMEKKIGTVRLVVVSSQRLLDTVAWTVQMHAVDATSRPAVLTRTIPDSTDDIPMPMLVLRGTPDDSASVVSWLHAGCPQQAVLADEPHNSAVVLSPSLEKLTKPVHASWGPGQHQDRQLLVALLSGACLVDETDVTSTSSGPAICGQQQYELVRRLLQSPVIATADEPIHELAVDMVNRANVFLKLKCSPELYEGYPWQLRNGDPIYYLRGARTERELVTRCEISDLGNLRSRLTQQIVGILQKVSGGHDLFQRMGLVRQLPASQDFRGSNPEKLVNLLRPWSPKQVRTHIGSLHKSGLITGERNSTNAPWQYGLPEDLMAVTSRFQWLPHPDEVFTETPTGG